MADCGHRYVCQVKNPPAPAKHTSSLLVVTDFADSSMQVILWAIPEAQARKLNITVLFPYRVDPLRRKENQPVSKGELDREALKKFEQTAKGMLLSSRIPFDFRSEVGFLRDRITDFARKNNVTLVVMDSLMAQLESFPELLTELKIPLVIVPSQVSV